MPKEDFIPCNALETALTEVKEGSVSVTAFLKILLVSDVHVPSSTEVDADGSGFRPLLFDKDGDTLMSVFTERQRANPFIDRVPYCLTMKGEQLLHQIPSEFGLVINPGWDVGMEIPSQGVQEIRRTFVPSL